MWDTYVVKCNRQVYFIPLTFNKNILQVCDSLFPVVYMYICMCVCVLGHFSCVQLFVTPWTIACQAPLSMGFSRQEYWSGLPFPPPRDLPHPGIEPESHVSCIDRWIPSHYHHLGYFIYIYIYILRNQSFLVALLLLLLSRFSRVRLCVTP